MTDEGMRADIGLKFANDGNKDLLKSLKDKGVRFGRPDSFFIMKDEDLSRPFSSSLILSMGTQLKFAEILCSFVDGDSITLEPMGSSLYDSDIIVEGDGTELHFQVKTVDTVATPYFARLLGSIEKFDTAMKASGERFCKICWQLDKSDQWRQNHVAVRVKKSNPYVAIHHWSFNNSKSNVIDRIKDRIRSARKQLVDRVESNKDIYKIICVDARFEALDEIFLIDAVKKLFKGTGYEDISGVLFLKDSAIPENHTMPLRLLPVSNEWSDKQMYDIDWIRRLEEQWMNGKIARGSSFLISADFRGPQIKYTFDKGSILIVNDTFEYGSITMPCGILAMIKGIAIKAFTWKKW